MNFTFRSRGNFDIVISTNHLPHFLDCARRLFRIPQKLSVIVKKSAPTCLEFLHVFQQLIKTDGAYVLTGLHFCFLCKTKRKEKRIGDIKKYSGIWVTVRRNFSIYFRIFLFFLFTLISARTPCIYSHIYAHIFMGLCKPPPSHSPRVIFGASELCLRIIHDTFIGGRRLRFEVGPRVGIKKLNANREKQHSTAFKIRRIA